MTTPDQSKALFARVTEGPAPYSRGPDENVKCLACSKFSEPDARFCDQCGAKLAPPAPTKPYVQGPGEEILCPVDEKYNAGDARYCSQCGNKLPLSAFQAPNPEVGPADQAPAPKAIIPPRAAAPKAGQTEQKG